MARQAREIRQALDQTIWAANPRQDSLDGLATYLCQFAHKAFSETATRCRQHVPALLPEVQLTSAVRYHLFLAVKEALTNALRHAHASEVELSLNYDEATHLLRIEVRDNGMGFDPGRHPQGHGLANMRDRLGMIGGDMQLESQPGRGTRVAFSVKVPCPVTPQNQPSENMDPDTIEP